MNIDNAEQNEKEITIVLIGDGTRLNLVRLLKSWGYRCHSVDDSRQALAWTEQGNEPDLLIVIGGEGEPDACQVVRDAMDYYLPVVAVVAQSDDAELEICAQSCVDVFVSEPLNVRALQMNIRFALRLRRIDDCRQRAMSAYREQLNLEQEVAATIYKNVLQSRLLNTDVVKATMPPMSLFSGDLLLVERTPDNHLHLLLGDFSCHGLAASVVASPAASIFYGMSGKGFSIVEIVREINAKLHKMLPINQYLAASAVVLYPETKKMGLISCGLPHQILVNDLDGSYEVIESKNIPLGVYQSIELEERQFTVGEHHHLYLMADGVIGEADLDGHVLDLADVTDAVSRQPELGFQALKHCLTEHTRKSAMTDEDISFIELVCDVDNVPWQSTEMPVVEEATQALTWKALMEFEIDTLRKLNPVPVMVNALMEIQGLQEHRQSVFLIVSELFANALDHGVLGLDSAIKASPEGFMRFYELKEERLQSFQEGKIRLMFAHRPTEQGGRLTIKVTDSGSGFDWLAQRQTLEQNEGFCGRGLKLLETLCLSLTYQGKGNRVTAVFDWQQ